MKKQHLYTILTIVLSIVLIIGIVLILYYLNTREKNELSYTDLIKNIAENNVEKIEMTVGSTSLKVTLREEIAKEGEEVSKEEEEKKEVEEESDKKKKYSAIIPNTQAFIELVQNEVALRK